MQVMAAGVGFEPTHGLLHLTVFRTVPLTTWVPSHMVLVTGLEPVRIAPQEPKS